VYTGTRSAYNARFHDADLTMWSSFRVSNSEMDKAWEAVMAERSLFSESTYNYIKLIGQSVRSELGKPDVLTRWYAVSVFFLQFVCIMVSCNVVNNDNTTLIFVTMLVCGLNIFLVSLAQSYSRAVFAFPPMICFRATHCILLVHVVNHSAISLIANRYMCFFRSPTSPCFCSQS
jgi:hypothetical protein